MMSMVGDGSPLAPATVAIFDVQRHSMDDGPGIRTTVFFKQCPLRCAWCQNPEGIEREPSIQWYKVKCIGCEGCVEACPEKAIVKDGTGIHIDRQKCKACGTCVDACPSTALKTFGRNVPVEYLIAEVAKDKEYYTRSGGGITASGGEPLAQADAVARFLAGCKERGMPTAIETCGATTTAALARVLPHVDLIMYDLKEIDPRKHEAFTGMDNVRILENCKWIASRIDGKSKHLWIRTPVVPGYTATDENISGIARFIKNELNGKVQRWDLLAFNNLAGGKYERMDKSQWVLKDTPLLARREMMHFHELALASNVPQVCWSGVIQEDDG